MLISFEISKILIPNVLVQVLNNIKVYLQEEEKRMIKQDEECKSQFFY